jgi:hypothetical protein
VKRGNLDPDPLPSGDKTQPDRALVRRGFIHVPMPDSKNPLGTTFTLDETKRGVLIVIDETIKSLPPPHSK